MLEELHKNPALAADPEQQLQFKRLAQQQLLYQMALAAQAAAPSGGGSGRGTPGREGEGDTTANFASMLSGLGSDGGLGALDQAAWALGPGGRDGDLGRDDSLSRGMYGGGLGRHGRGGDDMDGGGDPEDDEDDGYRRDADE